MKSNQARRVLYALVVMLGICALPTYAALSQGQQDEKTTGAPSIDDQVRNLTEKLNLTQDQQVKIRTILQDQQQQAQEAMGGNTLSREDKLSQVRRTQVTASSKIRELLTDEQKAKFDQMEKERREKS